MKAQLLWLSGKGSSQMVEGIHIDFEPLQELLLLTEKEYEQIASDAQNLEVFLMFNRQDYYFPIDKKFNIIQSESYKTFLSEYFKSQLKDHQSEKSKLKI